MMRVNEEELIEYVKPILKAQGFKKKAKRWTKVTEHFTYVFFIQGSCYDKDDYYVRPGIVVNDIQAEPWIYGHFFADIPVTTKEEVLRKTEEFFSQCSDVEHLKKTVSDFVEWEIQNPQRKRHESETIPASWLFTLTETSKEQIMDL